MDDPGPDILEPPPRRPRLKKLRLLLVLAGLCLLALVSTVFGMMMAVASDLPSLDTRAEYRPSARNSILTDVHGQHLATLTSDEGRVLVRLSDVAPAMHQAVIAIEDRRFYENAGVDLRGIARALWEDVRAGEAVQGGSTITQQFVKNATEAQSERTLFGKLREAALAYHLTRKWSKRRILENYLNTIYFGNGAYGIESAARTYFANDINHLGCGSAQRPCARELKPHEAALLAGVIASPSSFDPVRNPRAARERRDLVLRNMLEQGKLTPADHRDAVEQPLPPADQVRPPSIKSATKGASYFTSWVRQQVVELYGPQRAFEGGLRVQTTLDLELQRAAEEAVEGWLGNPDGPSAALVAIDNDSGEVRAMIGGRDYRERPFNLATQGRRQPGSAFKPFILAQALREGIGPGSVWASQKKSFPVPGSDGEEQFVVNNYEDAYAGPTTLARATTFSDNSVFAEVGIKVGVEKIAALAERMGIRTEVSENYAMTLGGLERGVTVLDMAHAYETFATGGERVTGTLGSSENGPVAVRSVRRREDPDEVLDRNRKRTERVLPEDVAGTTTSILQSVVKQGTASNADLGEEVAWGKTGTTENYGDAWFVGATEELTVAVWVGYPDKVRPMETEFRGQPVAGGTYPAEIWQSFMEAALAAERRALEKRCAEALAEARAEAEPGEVPEAPERCREEGLAPRLPGDAPPPAPQPAAPGTQEATAAPGQDEQATAEPAPAPSPEGGGQSPQAGGGGGGGGGQAPAAPAPAPATPAPSPPPAGGGAGPPAGGAE